MWQRLQHGFHSSKGKASASVISASIIIKKSERSYNLHKKSLTLRPDLERNQAPAGKFHFPIIIFSQFMKPLQAKLAQSPEPQKAKAAGVYPYFRAISSEQDPEV
ncbi:MAG: hypothetical protein K2K69_07695, partial [Muribaculaceae bacterium]|nr:hypothetical protein [Muribaculaceae bacterium]